MTLSKTNSEQCSVIDKLNYFNVLSLTTTSSLKSYLLCHTLSCHSIYLQLVTACDTAPPGSCAIVQDRKDSCV